MERYDYSRLMTFQTCPRKFDYRYRKGIEPKKNEFLVCGDIFHRILEGTYTGEMQIKSDALDEYTNYQRSYQGEKNLEPDLMVYATEQYLKRYYDDDQNENILGCEVEITDTFDADKEFVLRFDRLVEEKDSGNIILRDTKTTLNKLKYTPEDVKYNTQLLTYVPFVEDKYQCVVDAIEIDEVRLAKYDKVPFNANGKPSGDRKRLELVAYKDYEDVLMSMGLFHNREYANAIEWLQTRGDPLFRRTRVQLLDRNLISSTLKDIYNTIEVASDPKVCYRNKGNHCDWCEFRDLCNWDRIDDTDTPLRQTLIDKISAPQKTF